MLPFLEFYHLIDLHILSMSLVLQKNLLMRLFLAKVMRGGSSEN